MPRKAAKKTVPADGEIRCAGCPVFFKPSRVDQRFHSANCRSSWHNAQSAVKVLLDERNCEYCNNRFRPISRSQVFCSSEHRIAATAEKFLQVTVKIPNYLLTADTQCAIIRLSIENGKVIAISAEETAKG